MRILILWLLLSFSFSLQATAFSKKDFQFAVGGQYQSILQKRGIVTYKGYQVLPIYSIQLWNPNLLVAGSSLYYTHILVNPKHRFRLRLNLDSTLDRPLYYTSEKENERIRREETSEFDIFYEWRRSNDDHIRLQFSQDLVAHNGFYTELYFHKKLFNLLMAKNNKALLQPGVFAALGGGNKNHNEYLYGVGASHYSLTNLQYGFAVTSPSAIDVFWPTFKITRFELLGEENRRASYVREREGWQVELLFAFRVL
ncbi:MAG: hypothetical protein KDD40_07705 [Bdellovibrionales bacterium]|nr:hypothetical protein [Bdellovibrionales bacterium]